MSGYISLALSKIERFEGDKGEILIYPILDSRLFYDRVVNLCKSV